jgi:excisionase family DNA binding protein
MNEYLITISEASRILGVSEVALRHWTDEGKIKAFITPGGHRRYSKTELNNFMGSRQNAIGVKELIDEIEATSKLHSEIGRTTLTKREWYNCLDREKAASLAHLGRNMLNVIVHYLNEPEQTAQSMEHARNVGRGFGEILAGLELPLTDAVEAFILHRDPIMKAIAHLMDKREAHSSMIVEAIPIITRIMDEALLSLVAAHQQKNGAVMRKGGSL